MEMTNQDKKNTNRITETGNANSDLNISSRFFQHKIRRNNVVEEIKIIRGVTKGSNNAGSILMVRNIKTTMQKTKCADCCPVLFILFTLGNNGSK